MGAARGLSVPRDISVVGYGDLDIAAAMKPAITTVRTPADEMGRLAANGLLTKLAVRSVLLSVEPSRVALIEVDVVDEVPDCEPPANEPVPDPLEARPPDDPPPELPPAALRKSQRGKA